MNQEQKNLIDYIANMQVIASHLEAAAQWSTGIFQHNPASTGVPIFEDLDQRLKVLRQEVMRAGAAAEAKLFETQS